MSEEAGLSGTTTEFSNRILVYFIAQVMTSGLGIFNGIFLARLLGPSGKGDYYLLTLLPPTLVILSQLGLPQAFGFFSARGMTHGITARTVVLTAIVSIPVLAGTLALLPALQATILRGFEPAEIVLPLLALPLLLNATFTTGVVVGRQAARWLSIVSVSNSLSATLLILLLAGLLGLGVWGALIAFLLTAAIQAVLFLFGSARVTRVVRRPGSASFRELLRYALPFYPGSLTQFFGYRADVYLLALLLADPSAPLGYYSLAVSMAELVFFFPNAVSTFFFPRVAGGTREESDRQVPVVSRVTLLLTAAVGLVLVPVATIGILVVLPAFKPSLPALYVLLPGVVAISISKVLSGYLSGLGRTGLTSAVSIVAFVSNVLLNLYLIPRYGILGASAASLVSYTFSSILFSILAARLARVRATDFWIPRAADVRFAAATTLALLRQIRQRVAHRS